MASESEKAFAAVRSGDVDILAGLLAGNQSLAASRDENGVSLLFDGVLSPSSRKWWS